jgi:hypothetical protein
VSTSASEHCQTALPAPVKETGGPSPAPTLLTLASHSKTGNPFGLPETTSSRPKTPNYLFIVILNVGLQQAGDPVDGVEGVIV